MVHRGSLYKKMKKTEIDGEFVIYRESAAWEHYQPIRYLRCRHCDFQVYPDRTLGNFAKVSRAKKEMRQHVLSEHADQITVPQEGNTK